MKTKNNSMESKKKKCQVIVLSLAFMLIFSGSAISQEEKGNLEFKVGAQERVAIIDTIVKKMNEYYVLPEIAKKWEIYLRDKLDRKEYDNITNLWDFTTQITKDMLSVYNDGHLAITVHKERRDGGEEENSEEEWWNNYVKDAEYDNFGFYKLERLKGNIGYLDLRRFERPIICYQTAVAAMQFLSNSDAVIIDLRNNPGGREAMVQLIMSYFFEDHRTHWLTETSRLKGTTRQWWTLAEVPGKRMPKVPLYILTSFNTGSGAEEFSYSLKHLGRATLIGDTTAGAAYKTHSHVFPNLHLTIFLPDGNSICPATGKNWEETGVIPHISVSSDKVLNVAYTMALDSLLKMETDDYIRFKLEWVKIGIDATINPVSLDKKTMKKYVGQYEIRKITIKQEALYYIREGSSEYKLTPLGNDLFMVDGVDYFRIKFEKDKDGNISKLIGLYDDGTSSISKRTK